MKRIFVTLLLLIIYTQPAFAAKYDLEFALGATNDAFKDIVHETGALIAYRGIAPAEPSGITGFDVGVEVSVVDINSDSWDFIISDAPGALAVPKLHVRKGLPFNLDVGAIYSKVPESNIELFGAELQWAALEGSTVLPAVAIRGSFSQLNGVDDFDLSTYALDAVISKGFLMFTPYAGIGMVSIAGEYTGEDPFVKPFLKDQDFTDVRYFAGVQMSMAIIRLTLDAEFGEATVYTGKLSVGF